MDCLFIQIVIADFVRIILYHIGRINVEDMRRFLAILFLAIGMSSNGFSINLIQTDNAQKYLREAQQYNEKAERYEREAEQLTKKANNYTRQADNYAKKKDYRQSRLYMKWANEALSKAQLRLKWAKEARDKARLRMKWADEEMKRHK